MTPQLFTQKVLQRISHSIEMLHRKVSSHLKRSLAPLLIKLYSPLYKRTKQRTIRKKPKLLLVRNQFYSGKQDQLSTEYYHLDKTLEKVGLASLEVLTYEELSHIPLCDLQLIKKCFEQNPDALILSSWGNIMPNHPSIHAIQFIRYKMNIPVVSLWWDTCSKAFGKELKGQMDSFDVHVIMDNPCLHFIDKDDPQFSRMIALWPPQDEELFKPSTAPPSILLSFFGQVSSYRSYRKDVLDYLVEKKINGYFSALDREKQVTHENYATTMRNSKISLNFAQSVDSNQLKSRVMEVLFSRALLFESENEQTSKMFTPNKDYIPFSSKEDLLSKIDYFNKHEEERKQIAHNGYLTAQKNFSNKLFWEHLLKKIESVKNQNI